jgi:hypothetical protein
VPRIEELSAIKRMIQIHPQMMDHMIYLKVLGSHTAFSSTEDKSIRLLNNIMNYETVKQNSARDYLPLK